LTTFSMNVKTATRIW